MVESFPWKKTFIHYACVKTWILAYILITLWLFLSVVLPNMYRYSFAEFAGACTGAILIGFLGGFLFITLPISIICTLVRRILKKPISHPAIMTDAECMAAVEETIQNVPDYADIFVAAKAGDEDAHQKAWFDDAFIKELQENILTITGAQMSLDETRRYFSEWYLSKKEN